MVSPACRYPKAFCALMQTAVNYRLGTLGRPGLTFELFDMGPGGGMGGGSCAGAGSLGLSLVDVP